MKWFVYLLAAALLVLHQDTWNFHSAELVFGFLPIGLAYHAGFALACAVLMYLLVTFAWPKHLEKYENETPDSTHRPEGH
jgi:hypothetical protein